MKTRLGNFFSELLKLKGSSAFIISIVGALFFPLIVLLRHLYQRQCIFCQVGNSWQLHYLNLWKPMGNFILPLLIILMCALVIQIEHKNNTWKQLHTSPQSYLQIFSNKTLVLMLILTHFIVWFNIGVFLSAILPCISSGEWKSILVPPINSFLVDSLVIFLSCLPILSFQMLFTLRFRNAVIPIGIGMLCLIATILGRSLNYTFLSPFAGCILGITKTELPINIYFLYTISFCLTTCLAFLVYRYQTPKH